MPRRGRRRGDLPVRLLLRRLDRRAPAFFGQGRGQLSSRHVGRPGGAALVQNCPSAAGGPGNLPEARPPTAVVLGSRCAPRRLEEGRTGRTAARARVRSPSMHNREPPQAPAGDVESVMGHGPAGDLVAPVGHGPAAELHRGCSSAGLGSMDPQARPGRPAGRRERSDAVCTSTQDASKRPPRSLRTCA